MVGDNIKKIRTDRGMTQSYIADKLNVSDKTISSWEKNRTEPNMAYVEMLADVFSCRKSEIIGEAAVHTLAAHFEGIDFTDEEKQKIIDFAEFIRSQRKTDK